MSPYKNRKLEKVKLIVFMKFIPQNKTKIVENKK